MDRRSSRDFLSNLPLSIIHSILERAPIRDAVQTSILSRQWRYKWATLPHLSFEEDEENSETELKDFITQLLLLHQGPILKFEVCLLSETASQNLNVWLTFLARNGVTMLIMNLSENYDDLPLLPSVYSCQNLTNLELSNCDLPLPPPTFKGFLCLRRLNLGFVGLSPNAIQSILADLTLLEELRLEHMLEPGGSGHDLKINAPNLKILELKGEFQDIILYAPLLREMAVDFTEDLPSRENSVCNFTELLGGLTFLEKLKGNPYFFKFLSIGIESCDTPLEFPHLRLIELSPETFYYKNMESVLSHICKGAPNLHKIVISYTASHFDSECPFTFTFRWVKVIDIAYGCFCKSAGGVNRWMKLIKCLLARSPALETLICIRASMSEGELLEQASTLLAYPRASPNAKIVFRKI